MFSVERSAHRPEGVAQRVAGTRGDRLGIHLVDRVAQPVHGHVQAGAEEMLMMGGESPRCDQRAEIADLAGRQSAGHDDAGQLHLELDGAVLVDVAVDRVLVVFRRDDGGDDQTAAAAGLGRPQGGVEMLPQQAGVFLMQAGRLPDRIRLAVTVGERDVEIVDLAEAVTAELE